jgi:hypothetical protein
MDGWGASVTSCTSRVPTMLNIGGDDGDRPLFLGTMLTLVTLVNSDTYDIPMAGRHWARTQTIHEWTHQKFDPWDQNQRRPASFREAGNGVGTTMGGWEARSGPAGKELRHRQTMPVFK